MSSDEPQTYEETRYASLLLAAALLERSYRLALDVQAAGGTAGAAAELVSLLDDARVALLAAAARSEEKGGGVAGRV